MLLRTITYTATHRLQECTANTREYEELPDPRPPQHRASPDLLVKIFPDKHRPRHALDIHRCLVLYRSPSLPEFVEVPAPESQRPQRYTSFTSDIYSRFVGPLKERKCCAAMKRGATSRYARYYVIYASVVTIISIIPTNNCTYWMNRLLTILSNRRSSRISSR